MTNIRINWHVGYFASVNGKSHTLKNGAIHFYNEKGNIVRCDLDETAQFDIEVNCAFNVRKVAIYTRNEVFAIRHKGGDYSLFIPMSEVGFTKLGLIHKEYDRNKGLECSVYRRYSFNGTNLDFWKFHHDDTFIEKNGKIIYKSFIKTERTEKGNKVRELHTLIKDTCNVSIEDEDLADILEHFNITKKQ